MARKCWPRGDQYRQVSLTSCFLQPAPPLPPEVQRWQKQRLEYDRQWGQLSAAIKGSAIDPLPVNCTLTPEEMLSSALKQLEGVFVIKVAEFSTLEEDADVDDDPVLEEG